MIRRSSSAGEKDLRHRYVRFEDDTASVSSDDSISSAPAFTRPLRIPRPGQMDGTFKMNVESPCYLLYPVEIYEYNSELASMRTISEYPEFDQYCTAVQAERAKNPHKHSQTQTEGSPKPEKPDLVRWIIVRSSAQDAVKRLAEVFNLHELAVEDAIELGHRPRFEDFFNFLFFIVRAVVTDRHGGLEQQQISFFLCDDTVITVIPDSTTKFDFTPQKQRIAKQRSTIRRGDAAFLAQALLSAIVDSYFTILEGIGDSLEDLEHLIIHEPETGHVTSIHVLKRDLLLLRRILWPMRELLSCTQTTDSALMTNKARTFFRSVYDHCIQVIDIVETYREVGTGLLDLHISSLSNNLNEVMKILTLVNTIFIPLTFLAGVYGMNFQHGMFELGFQYGYEFFWLMCVIFCMAQFVYFRYKGWW